LHGAWPDSGPPLIDACADEVRAGRIDPDGAFVVLMTTVRDLFAPG
jgi:hypothetical protein